MSKLTWNGNTMGGDVPRLPDDAYFTNAKLAKAICRRLRETIGIPGFVIEPSAGDGAFVRAASETWDNIPTIIAVEPNATEGDGPLRAAGAHVVRAQRWEDELQDAERIVRTTEPVLIVGNPPFSLAEDHVTLAMLRLMGSSGPRYLSLLLRASFLAGQARVSALYDGPESIGGLRYVWHVIGRPSFTPDGKTDSAEYVNLVWQSGYRGPFEGSWLRWK